jgi:hypothetical protein
MTIIFIFSGQARTSPFNISITSRNMSILDSYNKFLFTDRFKSIYKYKIYISTNDIHLEDTIKYFNMNNIGNIHLFDTNYYYKPVKDQVREVEQYVDSYNKSRNWKSSPYFCKYDHSICQHHKILDCYNLFQNDNLNEIEYVIRMRLDTIIETDILDLLELFNKNSDLELTIDTDIFAIGKPNIMKCYCTGLDNKYGTYKHQIIPPINVLWWDNFYRNIDLIKWQYAPETQLFSMIIEYCINNKIDANKAINYLGANHFCKIIR